MKKINDILNNALFLSNLKIIEEYEKDRAFCKHNLDHSIAVARIMKIQSLEDGKQINSSIIYAISLLHDLGRAIQYTLGEAHAKESAKLAQEILPACNYTPEEIKIIILAIANHNNKDTKDYLSKLLRYADKISRNCFVCPGKDSCNWSENKKNKGITL